MTDADPSSGSADRLSSLLVGQGHPRIIDPVLQDHLEFPVVVPLFLSQLPHIRVRGARTLVLGEGKTVGHAGETVATWGSAWVGE